MYQGARGIHHVVIAQADQQGAGRLGDQPHPGAFADALVGRRVQFEPAGALIDLRHVKRFQQPVPAPEALHPQVALQG